MRRRPTRATAAVVAAGSLLIVMSGPAQATWLAVVGALVLGVAVGSLPVRHRLHHATVEVVAPERPRVGDDVTLAVCVAAPDHPLPLHRLELLGPPFGDVALLVDPLPRRGRARLSIGVIARARGVHDVQPVRLSTGAPFGLLRSSVETTAVCTVEVGPAIVAVPPRLLRAVTGATDAALERRRGGGDEVHAVRDYRTGDTMRDVHWRSTARAGRLVVKEHERPLPTRSAVAVVGGIAGPDFEALVSAAASIAHAWQRAGEPVDLARVDGSGRPLLLRGVGQHGLHSWGAAVDPVGADARPVVAALLDEVRPTTAVLAVAPGSTGIAEACAELLGAGCFVLLLSTPGIAVTVPAGVTHREVAAGRDVAEVLAEAQP